MPASPIPSANTARGSVRQALWTSSGRPFCCVTDLGRVSSRHASRSSPAEDTQGHRYPGEGAGRRHPGCEGSRATWRGGEQGTEVRWPDGRSRNPELMQAEMAWGYQPDARPDSPWAKREAEVQMLA